jgi:NAD(P)-dependent dehydrogenase (short-subunit alcohol dehydrogenase family)
MDLQLAGKRAIVTGGSRGIGKAIATMLAAEGAHVVIASRTAEALEAAAADIIARTGGKVLAIAADMSDSASVEGLVAATVEALGGVDILVNNAASVGGGGANRDGQIGEAILADLNVKVLGYMRMARAVAPHMEAGGWGRIINIGGFATRSTYNMLASVRNAAITAFAGNLADELGPKGITVTTLHPGFTLTERRSEQLEQRAISFSRNAKAPEGADVAYVATMLASPLSSAINGESILVGGGLRGTISY